MKSPERAVNIFALLLFTFAAFFPAAAAQPSERMQIHEVMYNPRGSDNNREFVEIYAPHQENLSGFIIGDRDSNDTLELLPLEGDGANDLSNYSLITEEGFNASGLSALGVRIYSAGKTIGDNLDNDGDSVYLYLPNGTLLDAMNYSDEMGGDSNNYSLERREDGSWGESITAGGTPGKENSIFLLSADYQHLVISEFLPDPIGDDDAPKPSGEWVELYNAGRRALYLGGLILKDAREENELVISDSNIAEGTLILGPDSHAVIYRDGDSDFSLNNDGLEEVRLFFRDSLLHSFSYSRTIEGMSWSNFEGNIFLSQPTPGEINLISENCDWFLVLETSSAVASPEDFAFTINVYRYYGLPEDITLRGAIEDVNGEIVREYQPWTDEYTENELSRSYSPNLREGLYNLRFSLGELVCEEDYPEDNSISRLVAINSNFQQTEPSMTLEKIYLGSDNRVQWGDQFRVKIAAYTGNLSSATLEAWVEQEGEVASQRTSLRMERSYQNYPLTFPLQLHTNCDENRDDGPAVLIAEGLGVRLEEGIRISGIDNSACKDPPRSSASSLVSSQGRNKVAYQLLELPPPVKAGDLQSTQISVSNDNQQHQFTGWAYVYRGSKCYSCRESSRKRDADAKKFTLQPGEDSIFSLPFTVDPGTSPGEYKLKVSIIKDAQKTAKELVSTILVAQSEVREAGVDEQGFSALSVSGGGETGSAPASGFAPGQIRSFADRERSSRGGIIVYQSSSARARETIPLFLAATFGLLSILLVWRRK